jgi:hypothetical protein
MKIKNVAYFIIVLILLIFTGFYLTNQKSNEARNSKVEENDQFLIIPQERIGNLLRAKLNKSNLFDNLTQAFGAQNVGKKDFYTGEGFSEPGFVIYPNTPNEVEARLDGEILIFRLPGFNDFYPQFFNDSNISYKGDWRLNSGLKIGSTLSEVEKINGKFFNLYGFGWDYGGTVSSWLDGNLPKELTIIFTTTNNLPNQEENKISGDTILKSNDPLVQKSKPVIQKIYIRW